MNTNNPGYDDLVALALGEVDAGDRVILQEAVSNVPEVAEQFSRIANTLSSIRPTSMRVDDGFNRRLQERWLREIEQDSAPGPIALDYAPVRGLRFADVLPRWVRVMCSYPFLVGGLTAVVLATFITLYLQRKGSQPLPAYTTSPRSGVGPPVRIFREVDQPAVPIGAWPMWGLTPHRNGVSAEKNPPTDWDVKTGKNILWSVPLGSKSYGNPIVAGGVVTVGTNNEGHQDPSHAMDGGVEMAFDQATGKLLWQKYYPKLATGRINDWPGEGLCATGYSEPGRLWYCTNTCHVVCLDLSPAAPRLADGSPPVLWDFDMIGGLGVFPHNMTSSAIAAYGDFIYVITGNGVDETHKHVVAPQAPDIVCFDKNTGNVVWTDNSPGDGILHGQWSSVAIAEVNGRAMVIAPLGDAWVYAFDAKTGTIIWKFDTNPKNAVYPATCNEIVATPCIAGKYMYIGTGQDPEHGEGYAHMYCVDITGHGDVSEELDIDPNAPKRTVGSEAGVSLDDFEGRTVKTKPNPNSKVVWHFDAAHHPGKISRAEHMNRTISTAVVTPEGLCIVPDLSGFLHCFDARTGEQYWSYDTESEMWGSPLYADGKIYVSDADGSILIFKASKTPPVKKDVIQHDMTSASYCSPVLVNGVLYIMTRDHLFAIKEGVQGKPIVAR